MQGVDAPQDAVDVDQHVLAARSEAPGGGLHVGHDLVAHVLAADLLGSGLDASRVVPDVVEARVDHEGVELVGAVRAEDRVPELGRAVGFLELEAHRELVRLPPVDAGATEDVDGGIDLELVAAAGGIDELGGARALHSLAGDVDAAGAEHRVPVHDDGQGREAEEVIAGGLEGGVPEGEYLGVHFPVGAVVPPGCACDSAAVLGHDLVREEVGLRIDV